MTENIRGIVLPSPIVFLDDGSEARAVFVCRITAGEHTGNPVLALI
jgi:hypothetical protein